MRWCISRARAHAWSASTAPGFRHRRSPQTIAWSGASRRISAIAAASLSKGPSVS